MADMPPVTTYPAALLDVAERDYRAHHLVESGPHAGRCAACGRADALDIAEQWPREFTTVVLLRRAGTGRVEVHVHIPAGGRAC